MTFTAAAHGASDPIARVPSVDGRAGTDSLFVSTPVVLLIGVCLGLTLSWPKLVAVWQAGAYFDADDAMRLVQVRDWLAGQSWFDLTAHRLDPPQGVLMHWTRIVDVPLALLLRLFSLFAAPDTAERLTRIAFPLLLSGVFFAAVIGVAKRLVGRGGIAAAVILAAFSVAVTAQFPPGRIDHHGAQITLLVLMLGATLDGLDPLRARRGAVAGGLAALSLGISIENLPFIVTMASIFGLAWIIRGAAMTRALAWFGGGLAASTLVVFAATIPPARYAFAACDAFSVAHLVIALIGGIGCLGLAAATERLPTPAWRIGGAGLLAAAVVAVLAVAFPDCLRDPLSGVDPLVRRIWLGQVNEARPMWVLLKLRTAATLPIAIPLVLGLACTLVAAWRERADSRARWLSVAAFAAIGLVGAFWQLRVTTSTAPIAALGGVWLCLQIGRWARTRRRYWLAAPVLAGSLFVPLTWAVALPDGGTQPAAKSAGGDPQACSAPAAFRALDALPPGLVFAPIDAGAYILVFTRHAVIAGPYHRNNRGNRLAIDALLGTPEAARDRIRASGARYVAICPAASDLSVYVDRAPDGFAASLRDGKVPAWLQPVAVPGTPFRVYEVLRD